MFETSAQIYRMVSSIQKIDGRSYQVYGLTIREADGVSTTIPDISCDKQFVSTMTRLFNLCQLPATRAKSVVIELLP